MFSTAVGSTRANPTYPDSMMDLWDSPRNTDCESLGSIKKFMYAFPRAKHAENPKGVHKPNSTGKMLPLNCQGNLEPTTACSGIGT